MPKKKSKKVRLDQLLVSRELFDSRAKAQANILAGKVLVQDEPLTKAGTLVPEDVHIRLKQAEHPWVSRGGMKMAKALDEFSVPVEGRVGLDVGASTGGFTDVLLDRGSSKVFAIDVGHNQLAWKLRNDDRVISHEGVNARELPYELIGARVDIVVMDVSFISVTKILPALKTFLTSESDLVVLVKPQFEVGKDKVGKGGIVRDPGHREEALNQVISHAENLGFKKVGLIESPITGADGNVEFLIHWKLV